MTYGILNEFSGSTLFPARRWLEREEFETLAEKAYLLILSLRILMCLPSTSDWAKIYLQNTISSSNFHNWRTTGTDLYVVLWALTEGEYNDAESSPPVDPAPFLRWLRAIKHDSNETSETTRLFMKLDGLLRNHDTSLRAIRRLVQDWPHASRNDQELAMTRLLQMIRTRARRAECLTHLTSGAKAHKLELHGVCNRETGKDCDAEDVDHVVIGTKREKPVGTATGFLAGLAGFALGYTGSKLVKKLGETATAGSTGASSVASVSGVLGDTGFDQNGHQGVYDKRKPKSTAIIRRPPIA